MFYWCVGDSLLRQELAVVYAAENYRTEPPTVESLRFTTSQLKSIEPQLPSLMILGML